MQKVQKKNSSNSDDDNKGRTEEKKNVTLNWIGLHKRKRPLENCSASKNISKLTFAINSFGMPGWLLLAVNVNKSLIM
jgi:hypothetical protein